MKTLGKNELFMLLLGSVLMSITIITHASDSNWHMDTKSYRVYLGVVPASMIKENPMLIDKEKSLHGGIQKTTSSSEHIMVSIYTKNENKRVENATTIAKIKNKKLIGRNKTIKPLEKMMTSGKVTYGNYFNLPKSGDYLIDVDIYQSNKNGYEKASFKYRKP